MIEVPKFYPGRGTANHQKDYLTKRTALTLCDLIKKRWAEKGYKVNAWPVPLVIMESEAVSARKEHYVVRSDMINGLPRSYVLRGFINATDKVHISQSLWRQC